MGDGEGQLFDLFDAHAPATAPYSTRLVAGLETIASRSGRLVENDAIVLRLEPLHRVVLGYRLHLADCRLAPPPLRHARARALEHDVEVHAVDTGRRVILRRGTKKRKSTNAYTDQPNGADTAKTVSQSCTCMRRNHS